MSRRLLMMILSGMVIATLACGGLTGGGGSTANPGATSSPGARAATTPGAGGSTETRSANLSEIKNTVEARETEKADWQPATVDQALAEGGGVKTGDESRARVDISDGTIVRMAPDTEFKLVTLSPQPTDPVTKFIVDAGQLFVRVTKALGGGSFEIETPSGVATVRGSLMSAGYARASGQLIVTCLEGTCRIGDLAGQTFTDLNEGEQSEIPGAGQGPLAAKLMDNAQLDDWQQNFPEVQDIIDRIRNRLHAQTPTPTPSGGGATGGGGQTACDHPYLPLRSGATWTYSTENGPTTWTVGSVTGDATSASAEVAVSTGAVQLTWHFQCDASGITSYDFGSISSSQSGVFIALKVTDHSGVLLPPVELLVPGYNWSNAYTLEIGFSGAGSKAGGTSSRSEQYSVASANPVTVNGQSFDGLQLSLSGTSTIQISAGAQSAPPITTSDTGTWTLARGVGIVQTTFQTENVSSRSELTSYSIP